MKRYERHHLLIPTLDNIELETGTEHEKWLASLSRKKLVERIRYLEFIACAVDIQTGNDTIKALSHHGLIWITKGELPNPDLITMPAIANPPE